VDICNIVDGDVSQEVISPDLNSMIKKVRVGRISMSKMVVKVPIDTRTGFKAIKYFTDTGIRNKLYP